MIEKERERKTGFEIVKGAERENVKEKEIETGSVNEKGKGRESEKGKGRSNGPEKENGSWRGNWQLSQGGTGQRTGGGHHCYRTTEA